MCALFFFCASQRGTAGRQAIKVRKKHMGTLSMYVCDLPVCICVSVKVSEIFR